MLKRAPRLKASTPCVWKGSHEVVEYDLDAQALTAFRPTSVDHFSTGLGRHTGTEAMRAFALQIAWLKSSFHRLIFELG